MKQVRFTVGGHRRFVHSNSDARTCGHTAEFAILSNPIQNVSVIALVIVTPIEIVDLTVVDDESTIPKVVSIHTVDLTNDIISTFPEAKILKCCFHCKQCNLKRFWAIIYHDAF